MLPKILGIAPQRYPAPTAAPPPAAANVPPVAEPTPTMMVLDDDKADYDVMARAAAQADTPPATIAPTDRATTEPAQADRAQADRAQADTAQADRAQADRATPPPTTSAAVPPARAGNLPALQPVPVVPLPDDEAVLANPAADVDEAQARQFAEAQVQRDRLLDLVRSVYTKAQAIMGDETKARTAAPDKAGQPASVTL